VLAPVTTAVAILLAFATSNRATPPPLSHSTASFICSGDLPSGAVPSNDCMATGYAPASFPDQPPNADHHFAGGQK